MPLHSQHAERRDDRLPFTCLVPDAPGVIDIYDQTAALDMAVVDREAVHALGGAWDAPGAHVLLDRPNADGSWSAYVGKAPAGPKARIGSHLRNGEQWCRVLLLQRDTTHGSTLHTPLGWRVACTTSSALLRRAACQTNNGPATTLSAHMTG